MCAKYYTNDNLELQIPVLQYGKLAILAAQQGIDISKLIIREAAELRKRKNSHSLATLPPVPVPAAVPAGIPQPVVVTGEDPDLNLR